ncbi:MAG: aminopeptidase P family protein, partial [Deltaproteobacteria bacterium]|nr:aminopeptidase P family protein [Deltaproteobacteria bacterium]
MASEEKRKMLQEKLAQAQGILGELDVDLWLTFVRESALLPDPALEMVVGTHVTWQSAFLVPASGETLALVGSLDRANMEAEGVFARVDGYLEGIGEPLRAALSRLDPRRVAINFSEDSEIADGLTHGMYLTLLRILQGTPYGERLVSAEPILARLRGRKTSAEVLRLQQAVQAALEILGEARGFIRPGRTEQEVAEFINGLVRQRGLELAWEAAHCPAVFSGPETAGAHASPTARHVEPGHVVNIDFGVKTGGYCSDLQRTYYVPRPGEVGVPEPVQHGLRTIVEAIGKAAAALRPGVAG